jgi:hypothetical protein
MQDCVTSTGEELTPIALLTKAEFEKYVKHTSTPVLTIQSNRIVDKRLMWLIDTGSGITISTKEPLDVPGYQRSNSGLLTEMRGIGDQVVLSQCDGYIPAGQHTSSYDTL